MSVRASAIASLAAALSIGAGCRAMAADPAPAKKDWTDLAREQILKPRHPPSTETPEHAARMGWWREAKFGMFIHWGLYAVPAGVYQGKQIPGNSNWIMKHAQIPATEYEQYARQFNPERFDADAWARLAQDAGMKYVILTAKDHDGFAMFGSGVSHYNIVDATPFHRDPVKELAAACAQRGLRFGLYYSHAQDWHNPSGAGNTWDFGPDDKKDFDEYLNDKSLPQVQELLTSYGALSLLFFDDPVLMTSARAGRFDKLVHALQPDCLIGGSIGPGSRSDFGTAGENDLPPTVRSGDWEARATLDGTVGFKNQHQHWKTPEEVLFTLVDVVSKGGNDLLDIGPDAQGVIPQESRHILRDVGNWMKVNGEAIYGAGPSPFGEEFGEPSGKLDVHGRPIYNAPTGWRVTTRAGKLYFAVFHWPKDGTFTAPPIAGTVKRAYLLADPAHKALPVHNTETGIAITVPAEMPTPIASEIVVETE